MKMGDKLPSLDGAGVSWLDDTAVRKAALAPEPGTVLLVHFFAVSCEQCKSQLPTLVEWRDKTYAGRVQLVGVHMPRYPDDVDLPRVKSVVAEYGLAHPVAVDDEHTITDRFANEFVPAYYTFDAERTLVHKKAGDTALGFVEKAILRGLTP
ncbi:MAG: redoxin domain-containing protein [Deltaproteobacteria bacterium]|nr:redoxin domain-containing protein [Deltaproteobacteria bacterium]